MKATLIALVLIVTATVTIAYGLVLGSLSMLDGTESLGGLADEVTVDRDDLGVVTIRGKTRADVARALGFVHAQDRFFQMDLMRRDAAGELAALLGAAAIPHDRKRRIHRLRQTAKQVVAQATETERMVLAAYTEGVNAGIGALPVRPFEYLLLRSSPEPWRREDSILTIFAMYFQLNDEDGVRDGTIARLHDALSPALFRFLTVAGTDWDAPLIGEAIEVPPVPGPDACDLREGRTARRPAARELRPSVEEEGEVIVGSNGWAVAASHSASGRAILANNMHLGLRVPNTWYRARGRHRRRSPGAQRRRHRRDPPRHSSGDRRQQPPRCLGLHQQAAATGPISCCSRSIQTIPTATGPPNGYRRFEDSEEQIVLRGGDPEILPVRSTIWGPVVGKDHRGRRRALRWLAHEPDATNLRILDLEHARDVSDAISVAHRAGIPPQNFIVADADGHIAWTIIGHIPLRRGYDTRLPVSWADGDRGVAWVAPRGPLPGHRQPAPGTHLERKRACRRRRDGRAHWRRRLLVGGPGRTDQGWLARTRQGDDSRHAPDPARRPFRAPPALAGVVAQSADAGDRLG